MSAEDKTPDIIFDRVNVAICSLCGCDIDVAGIDPFLQMECPDCGSLEPVPGKLGPFLLLELLGTGGMGGVYKARDTALGRLVGIKVMLSSVGEDAQFIETFRREAQAAAKLNHPNIAQIYSFGQEKGQPYIVMELVSGQHFDKMVDEEASLDQGLIMQVGYDIALGLQAADEIHLIHGDIKPENILLDEKMSAKLVDFGIASFAHQGAQEGIWGTPYYICPEKIRKQPVDARSDIYSLGATLYHAITKHPPFDGKTPIEVVKARLNRPPLPMGRYRKDINPRVNQIINRMLQLEPSRRYPNYSSLLSDIRKATMELGSGSRSRSKMSKKGRKVIISKHSTAEQRPSSERRPAVKTKRTIKAPPSSSRSSLKTTHSATTSDPAEGESDSAIKKYKNQSTQVVKPEKKGKGGLIALMVVLVVLLAGTGLGLFLYIKDKNIKAYNVYVEMTTLAAHKQTGENTYAQILTVASNVSAIAESALEHNATGKAAVLLILGDPLQPEEPVAPFPGPKQESTPQREGDSSAIEKKADGTEMPAGMLTRAQLDAGRNKTMAPPPAAPRPGPEPEDAVETVHPIKVLAKRIAAIAAELQSNSEEVEQIAVTCFANKSKVDTSRTSKDAAGNLATLTADLTSVSALHENSTTIFAALQTLSKEAGKMKDEKDTEEAARLKAIKEEEDRRNAEIEAQRKAEEYAELVKNEMELAEAARKMNEPFIAQLNFEEAATTVRSQVSDYKSKEGRESIAVLLDKYERLAKFKLFLIESINKTPYKWGYGRGTSTRDIASANDEGLQISGIPQTLPWDSVSPKLFLKITNHYLANKRTRIRVLGEGNLGAAIYCKEIANGNDAALLAARKYAETATEFCEDLQEHVERLLQF